LNIIYDAAHFYNGYSVWIAEDLKVWKNQPNESPSGDRHYQH